MPPLNRSRRGVPLARGDPYRRTSRPVRVRHHALETGGGLSESERNRIPWVTAQRGGAIEIASRCLIWIGQRAHTL